METEQLQNKHNVFIFSAAHDICHNQQTLNIQSLW